MRLAIPSIGSMLVGHTQFMADMYFVGKTNNLDIISGVGVGNMIINLVGVQIFIGLNGALETLVP